MPIRPSLPLALLCAPALVAQAPSVPTLKLAELPQHPFQVEGLQVTLTRFRTIRSDEALITAKVENPGGGFQAFAPRELLLVDAGGAQSVPLDPRDPDGMGTLRLSDAFRLAPGAHVRVYGLCLAAPGTFSFPARLYFRDQLLATIVK